MKSSARDFVFSLKALRRSPSFTVTAAGILAVAIGALSLVFGIFQAVVLRSIPGPYPRRIVAITQVANDSSNQFGLTSEQVTQLGRESTMFEVLGYYRSPTRTVIRTETGTSREAIVTRVSTNFFSVFAATPALGRAFSSSDSDDNPVVLSQRLWREMARSDALAVGGTITVEAMTARIIGIMPDSFQIPSNNVDAWLVDRVDARANDGLVLRPVGRLARGMSLERARGRITSQPTQPTPQARQLTMTLDLLLNRRIASAGLALTLLLGVVAVVSLIACLNVATLILARTERRRHEIAIQVALGAERSAIVRQRFMESVVLAVLGSLGGTALVVASLPVLRAFGPSSIPHLRDATVDGSVLGVVALAGLISSVLCALPVVIRTVRVPSTVRGAGLSWVRRIGRYPFEAMLITAQTMLVLSLVTVAAMLLQSLVAVVTVSPRFDTEGLLGVQFETARRPVPGDRERIVTALGALPGVRGVATAQMLRLSFGTGFAAQRVTGEWLPFPGGVGRQPVSQNFFSTTGMALLEGRTFDDREERGDAPCKLVVNQALAASAWPGQSALGRYVDLAADLLGRPGSARQLCEVIGVADNATLQQTDQIVRPLVYVPPDSGSTFALLIRVERSNAAAMTAVTKEVIRTVPNRTVAWFGRIADLVQPPVVTPGFFTFVVGWLTVTALSLCGAGTYSSIAQLVARRQREIGLRLALGADAASIRAMLSKLAIGSVVIGLIPGAALALAAGRAVRSLLSTAAPADLTAVGVAAVVILSVGFLVTFLAVRHAAHALPTELLRSE